VFLQDVFLFIKDGDLLSLFDDKLRLLLIHAQLLLIRKVRSLQLLLQHFVLGLHIVHYKSLGLENQNFFAQMLDLSVGVREGKTLAWPQKWVIRFDLLLCQQPCFGSLFLWRL